jgi:hypothetical protein
MTAARGEGDYRSLALVARLWPRASDARAPRAEIGREGSAYSAS